MEEQELGESDCQHAEGDKNPPGFWGRREYGVGPDLGGAKNKTTQAPSVLYVTVAIGP